MNTKNVFDLIRELALSTENPALAYNIQHKINNAKFEETHERERMIEEVTQRALSHIQATVDTKELFDALDGLNDKIISLGK